MTNHQPIKPSRDVNRTHGPAADEADAAMLPVEPDLGPAQPAVPPASDEGHVAPPEV
jgi:hypothetical protein